MAGPGKTFLDTVIQEEHDRTDDDSSTVSSSGETFSEDLFSHIGTVEVQGIFRVASSPTERTIMMGGESVPIGTGDGSYICPFNTCQAELKFMWKLKKHLQWVHFFDVNTIAEIFQASDHRLKKLMCSECGQLFSTWKVRRIHFANYHSSRVTNFKVQKIRLNSSEQFVEWKKKMEVISGTCFVNVGHSSQMFVHLACNRQDVTPSQKPSVGIKRPHWGPRPSIKTEKFCPVYIEAHRNNSTGCFDIEAQFAHNHEVNPGLIGIQMGSVTSEDPSVEVPREEPTESKKPRSVFKRPIIRVVRTSDGVMKVVKPGLTAPTSLSGKPKKSTEVRTVSTSSKIKDADANKGTEDRSKEANQSDSESVTSRSSADHVDRQLMSSKADPYDECCSNSVTTEPSEKFNQSVNLLEYLSSSSLNSSEHR